MLLLSSEMHRTLLQLVAVAVAVVGAVVASLRLSSIVLPYSWRRRIRQLLLLLVAAVVVAVAVAVAVPVVLVVEERCENVGVDADVDVAGSILCSLRSVYVFSVCFVFC